MKGSNRFLRSGVADYAVKKPDQTKAQFISQRYCNSFAIAIMNPEILDEWQPLVTCVQHNAIKSCGIQRDDARAAENRADPLNRR